MAAILLVVAMHTVSVECFAQASPADREHAAELFKQSVSAYRQGDFKHAVELLDEAYRLDPQPVLVYNRARAAEGLGNVDEAIAGYEKFLEQEPTAEDRGGIQQRITTLRRQREERAALLKEREERAAAAAEPAQPAPPPAPALAATRPASPSVLPFVVGGVGLAAVGAGAVLGLVAVSRKSDAVEEPVQAKAMDDKSAADGLATASTVAFIAGGVLVAAGAVWWFLNRGAAAKPAVAMMASRGFAGFTFGTVSR